jgi:3-hydroxybutyryl-CoA dehydrogenase
MPRPVKTVGVVGAGTIGIGVARALAQTGHEVILIDLSDNILRTALARMDRDLRLDAFSDPALRSTRPEDILGHIACSTDLARLRNVDYLIENVTENLEIKLVLYPHLDAICPPDCIFAANTSAVEIARLAGVTSRPDRVIGLHFMNPVSQKPCVELIRPGTASDATLERTQALLSQMGKSGITVADRPGFVSNRMLMPFINEAVALVHEGVASPRDVDRIFETCMSHKMGPLATADLIGLDTVLKTLEELLRHYNDPKYSAHPLLREMVVAGKCGRKSGHGFFEYPSLDMKNDW